MTHRQQEIRYKIAVALDSQDGLTANDVEKLAYLRDSFFRMTAKNDAGAADLVAVGSGANCMADMERHSERIDEYLRQFQLRQFSADSDGDDDNEA